MILVIRWHFGSEMILNRQVSNGQKNYLSATLSKPMIMLTRLKPFSWACSWVCSQCSQSMLMITLQKNVLESWVYLAHFANFLYKGWLYLKKMNQSHECARPFWKYFIKDSSVLKENELHLQACLEKFASSLDGVWAC